MKSMTVISAGARISAEIAAAVRGRGPGRAELSAAGKKLRKALAGRDGKRFISYAVEDGRPLWVWVSEVSTASVAGRAGLVNPCYVDTARIWPGPTGLALCP